MWETIIIQPFTNVLILINALVNNFGISIILFTILIRLITHPLTVKQFKATQSMQKLQEDPRYKKMQEKYKNDREKLAQEQMKLYKELGINPMGSCLPTLIQFPIIIGLWQSVNRAMAASPMELYKLEEMIYPWVKNIGNNVLPLNNNFLWMNLGQPERIYIGAIGIPLLAILIVITTFLQSKLLQPASPSANDQAAQMNKSMSIYMPLLMGFMAYSYASGLALYFLASNIFGIVQYAILGRANWSNILPFLKKKGEQEPETKKVKIVEAEVKDVPEVEEVEPVQESDSSQRTMTKRMRPKRKK